MNRFNSSKSVVFKSKGSVCACMHVLIFAAHICDNGLPDHRLR